MLPFYASWQNQTLCPPSRGQKLPSPLHRANLQGPLWRESQALACRANQRYTLLRRQGAGERGRVRVQRPLLKAPPRPQTRLALLHLLGRRSRQAPEPALSRQVQRGPSLEPKWVAPWEVRFPEHGRCLAARGRPRSSGSSRARYRAPRPAESRRQMRSLPLRLAPSTRTPLTGDSSSCCSHTSGDRQAPGLSLAALWGLPERTAPGEGPGQEGDTAARGSGAAAAAAGEVGKRCPGGGGGALCGRPHVPRQGPCRRLRLGPCQSPCLGLGPWASPSLLQPSPSRRRPPLLRPSLVPVWDQGPLWQAWVRRPRTWCQFP